MVHMSDLLQNIANMIVFIMLANRIYPFVLRWNKPLKQSVVGVLFSLAGLISMNMPIEFSKGITIDLKAIVAGMSGLLGGPISAAISLASIGSYRYYLGGLGMLPGLICIAAAAITGTVLHLAFRRRRIRIRRLGWPAVFFGVMIALVQLATTFMFPKDIGTILLREFSVPLLVLYPLAALVFHYFMAVEWARQYEAMYDRPTGIPRTERLHRQWERRIRKGLPFSLVLLNAERLRTVGGNEMLTDFTRRLAGQLPPGGALSRHDGSHFVVSLPSFDMLQSLIWIVDAKKSLTQSDPTDGPAFSSFSTGLAVYEGGTVTPDELMLQAETALRHALESGHGQTVPYDTRLTEQMRYRTSLEKDLRYALERGQLSLHYQPQYELNAGKLRGFEALLRWNHPDWGPISPAEFIPLAEETRLIIPIGEWVLETACRMAMKLDMNESGTTMAVNVSAVQLLESDFPDKVNEILRRIGLRSDRLELELTESTLVRSFELAAERLLRLKEWGVRLALDDFGVGYSSLSYLRRLPFDIIKIDRSFIEDIGRSRDDRMTKSIIDWVRELRYGIVAEGLESYDQLYWLKQWKCDIAQGFLFSRPMAEEDLLHDLRHLLPLPFASLSPATGGTPV